jgi:hypothetical protein
VRRGRLARPPLAGWPGLAPWWKLAGLAAAPAGRPDGYSHWAVANERELYIYGSTGEKAWNWGEIRQGQRVPVRYKKAGDHCKRGNWYVTPGAPGGSSDDAYLCNTHGFTITREGKPGKGVRPPALDSALPFTYLKASEKPTLQFERLPTAKELKEALEALESGVELPDVVEASQEGAFFVALDRPVKGKAGTFYLTIAGHYVRTGDMVRVKASDMRGELLGKGGARLPLAFVHGASAPVSCRRGSRRSSQRGSRRSSRRSSRRGSRRGSRRSKVPAKAARPRLVRCGTATRHARLRVVRELERGGKRYVEGPGEKLLARDDVRIARKIKRPKEVDDGDKWVHYDLSRQVLVAYEGDRPVFTTLFSSGKEGHDTPTGTFRILLKRISTRMSGDDPKDGPYDIGEVPWVMYYKDSYAVHGAYWHDVFGEVRSHGCTNLSPADARWLFFWTAPRVPTGWHGLYAHEGTVFHFTR